MKSAQVPLWMSEILFFSPQPLFPCTMNKNSRLHTNFNIGNIFFSEIGIGISGNSFLLLFHIIKFFRGHRPRLTDLPIGLLSLIHLLMLLVAAVIATDIFISWREWDDIICKFLLYLYRVLKGFSLCTTSMLSVLQAIILSPRSSCLSKFKHKSPHHISCTIIFLSVLYMLIGSHLLSIIATPNLTTNDFIYITQSCSILSLSYLMQSIYSTLVAIREVFLISLMVLSTWYMVALLCMYRKQTHFFVLMTIYDIMVCCSRAMFLNDPTSYSIKLFIMHIYATVSPFVFMSTEKHIVNFLRSMGKRMINLNLH
uniref:Vomeronasal type-1 receptor n=1 Tax=Mus spicilegus TaxID=10103 RepID=A0A8C6N2T0_MUSSI